MKKALLSITALATMAMCCVSCEKNSTPSPPLGNYEVNGAYYKPSTGTDMTCEFTHIVKEDWNSEIDPQDVTISYTVPETVEIDGKRYTVVSIGSHAFNSFYKMKSVTLPKTITSIGDQAFPGCVSLTSIDIPESVTSIGDAAFHGCSALSSIKIPANVTRFGGVVFSRCTSLESVTLSEGLASLGDGMFEGCTSLNEGVEVIGDHAFQYCSKITSIDFPSTLKLIERYAFNGCSGIDNITIPDGVEEIGEGAFWDCYKMKTLTLGSGIKTIGTSAFQGCSRLTGIYCRATDIPETGWNPFDWEAFEKITLHVPLASLANYKAHEEWGQFKNIVAM